MKLKTKKQRIGVVLAVVIILAIAFLTVRFFGISMVCPSHALFGIDCTGCGVTRMILALSKGDIYQAFRYNPAVFILLPFLLVYIGFAVVSYINGTPNKLSGKIPYPVLITIMVLLVLFGILRNIPMFSFLAPTVV